jgi:hypothetical protein
LLNTTQKWIVFVLFCLYATACVALEGFLVYSIVKYQFGALKITATFLNTSVLVWIGRRFGEMISKTFLKSDVVSPDRLYRIASDRCGTVENARRSGEAQYQTRRSLIGNTLKFSEESLRGWVAGSHFELCVFVDQEQPLLFAYFDSNHDVNALSMKERERNPLFYVEKGYEVTKLLRTPTSYPRVINDTQAAKAKYVFTSAQQRKQIKSSLLLCLDVATPCALVITSNEKNAFHENDPDLMSFIKYIGASVLFDLFDGNFVHHIRELRPELFNG